MRLHFHLSPSREAVPFDYPYRLAGRFHAWLGQNALHDDLSLYSLSWLQSRTSRPTSEGLLFPNGASWFVSAPDTPQGQELLETIFAATSKSARVAYGMEIVETESQNTPEFGECQYFRAASPVLVRARTDSNRDHDHLPHYDERTSQILTQTLSKKLEKAGKTEWAVGLEVRFDTNYAAAKTKLVTINNIRNKANFCPVIIQGHPEALKFAWNTGIGHGTGVCFGSLI